MTSGFRKYPKNRDKIIKTPRTFLDGIRETEGYFPYWRIHDNLYALKDFAKRHPGGSFWIEMTQGTDITEPFESSHFGLKHEQLLEKFFVKKIETPRNSPYTFRENGFFKTLKRKVSLYLTIYFFIERNNYLLLSSLGRTNFGKRRHRT